MKSDEAMFKAPEVKHAQAKLEEGRGTTIPKENGIDLDLILRIILQEPKELPDVKPNYSNVLQVDPAVKVPHIDSVFGDKRWIIKDCAVKMQIFQLESLVD